MSDYENGAKLKQATSSRLSEIIGTKAKATTAQKAEVEEKRDANISSNTFYKIIFDPNLTPDQKQKEVAQKLAAISTKEENRIRVQELENIKEYLQLQRENMASKIIALTDTDTMARLQQVYTSMNNGMLEFNEALQPILDIVDAMNTVRKEGKTADVFSDIRNDRRNEEALNAQRAEIESAFKTAQLRIDNLNYDNANLAEEKSLFGFGGIKKEAQQQINVNNMEIEKAKAELSDLQVKLETLTSTSAAAEEGAAEYVEAKKTIRKMLDLASDQHKENQKKTVDKALEFVKTSKTSINDIKGHLTGLNGQIDNLTDANHTMITAYAILGEGMKEAEGEIVAKRNDVVKSIEGESMIAKMQRDDVIRTIDEHTSMLAASAADTELTYADLSSQSSRIKTMKDSNKNQMDKVQKLATAGVAGTADRLSVMLQAVGAAAIGESSEIARETILSMNDKTNEIAMKESMRVAFGTTQINSDIQKAMEDLAAYGEVTRAATDVTRESVAEMRAGLDQLKEIATSLQDDLKTQGAIYSEANSAAEQAGTPVVTPSGNNPFKI
jgi:hypothetical protein